MNTNEASPHVIRRTVTPLHDGVFQAASCSRAVRSDRRFLGHLLFKFFDGINS